ncbi:MAG: hypothetical protein J5496_04255 [Lachnospiraceae bacterium]|nr:hypothetical protein [Lachnospiraceae bacterium]
MNAYDLLDAVNGVDTDMIQEAETAGPKSGARRKAWRKIAVAAACLTLAAVGGILRASAGRKETSVQERLLSALSSLKQSEGSSTYVKVRQIPLGNRIATYGGLSGPYHDDAFPAVQNQYTEKMQAFVGPVIYKQESVKWHAVTGLDGFKYLIREDEDGMLSLWEFMYFITVAEAETEGKPEEFRREWEQKMQAAYPGAVFSYYTYEEMFQTVYGVKSWEDIAGITAAPSQANNSDLGREIQKQVGTKVFDDPETIRAFYDCVTDAVCRGDSSWATYFRSTDPVRFTYSFSTDATDKLASGESIWGERWLTITLKNGTTIDCLKYNSLAGVFYENGAVFSELLSDEQVAVLNGIFGIR